MVVMPLVVLWGWEGGGRIATIPPIVLLLDVGDGWTDRQSGGNSTTCLVDWGG